MQLIPTIPMTANFDGECVSIDIQEGVQLRLTPHQAVRLSLAAQGGASDAMHSARFREPNAAEIIAFPAAKVRRAIVAARNARRA